MIGLVVVSHGRLAEEFTHAVEHVVGPQKQMVSICIGADDDLDERTAEIRSATQQVNSGDGVILLTDMFGGTPSNLALKLLSKDQVEVLAGINLPMLIKLAEARTSLSLEDTCQVAVEAGRKYMAIASQVLGTRT